MINNYMIEEIRKQIKFPYKKRYIKYSIDELYNNLKNYEVKLEIVEPYEIYNIKYFKKPINTYKNKYRQFINDDEENYEKINILSDYFSEKCRIKCKRYDSVYTPEEGYNNDKILTNIIEELQKTNQEITNETLREKLYEKIPECANFKLTLAYSVIKYFKGTRVLDISAGWGDRLIGAIAYDKLEYYDGYDPSLCMKKYYKKIINKLSIDKDKYKVETIPFEDSNLTRTYNLIFTSPPFFDLEVYEENNEKQSITNASDIENWFNNMLMNWLRKAYNQLETKGHMVINIEDKIKKYGEYKTETLYTERMINEINKFEGIRFDGVIGHKNINKSIVRPLFIWKKLK
jgi:hypothetical protein